MPRQRLLETTDLNELDLVKITLNHHGIDYHVLHEHTLTAGSFASMGMGGAIVEVVPEDYDRARALLLETGLRTPEVPERDQFAIIATLEAFTADLPLVGKLDLSVRLLVVVFLLLGGLFLYFSLQALRS